MLERISMGDLRPYISPLLTAVGVPHAFSTRAGGMSPAPFDSLNLGNPGGCATIDDTNHIAENYRRLQAAIGCHDRTRFWTHQVHAGEVIDADAGGPPGEKADAIVTRNAARVLAIRVADCVPVLLASDDGQVVGAAHAGWRGVIAGVVPHTIAAMRVSADRITAAIGPSISFDSFEVGIDVLAAFDAAFPDDPPLRRDGVDGKGQVDLRAAIRQQLLAAGVPETRIDSTDACTVRDREDFFSHRRDAGITGRMAALIATRVK